MGRGLGERQTALEEEEAAGQGEQTAGLPLMSPRLRGWQLAAKRMIDVLVSLGALPVFVPLGLLAAIAVKLDSEGGVFYRQRRVGQAGRPFTMYKFRSMYKNADGMLGDLREKNEAAGPVFKIRSDPRITRVGAFLRRTSLDELPQIINVLKGEMSLVGPRPPLPHEVENYNDYQRGRLAVKPGLTCLWQVRGRSNISFDQWVEMDLEYIHYQSLWLDFKILLKTIPAVLKGTGAW